MEQLRVQPTAWPGIHLTEAVSRRHFGRHWHEEFGIGVLEAGAQTSASGRGPVQGQAGDILTVNPGEVHDGHPLGEAPRRWRMVYLTPSAWCEALAEPDGPALDASAAPQLTRPVLQDPQLAHTLRLGLAWLAQPAEPASSGVAPLAAESALVALAHGLRPYLSAAPAQPLGRPEAAPLARVRARLLDDLARTPTLAELAAEAGRSRFQVLRHFQAWHGVSPHAWLMLARLHRARQLIRPGCALAEVAAACGFADQSHMTRSFRACLGYTPGQWLHAQGG